MLASKRFYHKDTVQMSGNRVSGCIKLYFRMSISVFDLTYFTVKDQVHESSFDLFQNYSKITRGLHGVG